MNQEVKTDMEIGDGRPKVGVVSWFHRNYCSAHRRWGKGYIESGIERIKSWCKLL